MHLFAALVVLIGLAVLISVLACGCVGCYVLICRFGVINSCELVVCRLVVFGFWFEVGVVLLLFACGLRGFIVQGVLGLVVVIEGVGFGVYLGIRCLWRLWLVAQMAFGVGLLWLV